MLVLFAMPNIMHTTHFIVNLFMSKVYNESSFKINQSVSCLFLWICIIHLCSTVQIFPHSVL